MKITENAEYAATYLKEITWGQLKGESKENKRSTARIVEEELHFNTQPITKEEVEAYLRKAKRRKAAGPDEIPLEFFKEMLEDEEAITNLTNN